MGSKVQLGKKGIWGKLWDCRTLILMCTPAILFFIIFLYTFVQKYFISGIAIGAVKG